MLATHLGKAPLLLRVIGMHCEENLSAASHSDVQYTESLWTIGDYVMRLMNCLLDVFTIHEHKIDMNLLCFCMYKAI